MLCKFGSVTIVSEGASVFVTLRYKVSTYLSYVNLLTVGTCST